MEDIQAQFGYKPQDFLILQEMAKITQDELRQTLITIGARTTATKASMTLAELLPNTLALNIPHLAERQTWLIEEALRIDKAIKSMDKQIIQ
ncbi:hypothetical protein D3C76_1393480 [compost metagenome]